MTYKNTMQNTYFMFFSVMAHISGFMSIFAVAVNMNIIIRIENINL
jgi:hypothetical protein